MERIGCESDWAPKGSTPGDVHVIILGRYLSKCDRQSDPLFSNLLNCEQGEHGEQPPGPALATLTVILTFPRPNHCKKTFDLDNIMYIIGIQLSILGSFVGSWYHIKTLRVLLLTGAHLKARMWAWHLDSWRVSIWGGAEQTD